MKRFTKSLVALLLVLITLISCLPLTAFAAKTPTLYETIKDAPIWSQAHSKSTKLRVADEGSFLKVVDSVINIYGNKFYKLSDDAYVFSGNVKIHTHASAICSLERVTYKIIDDQTHKRTGTMDDMCLCKAVLDTHTTIKVEQHYFGSKERCVCGFEKPTIHVHAYKNGYCSSCGAKEPHTHAAVACGEEKLSYTPNNATTHTVHHATPLLCSCGSELGTENKTSTEGHSFNLFGTKCKLCGYQPHICKANSGGAETVSFEQSSKDSHVKVTRTTDSVCLCGQVVKKGTTTLATEAHRYDSKNKCLDCGWQKHTCTPAAKAKSQTYYDKISPEWHQKIQETPATVCTDCGKVIIEAKQTKTVEEHTYSAGKCTGCGYKLPTEGHKHLATKQGESFYTYSYNLVNSEVHITTKKTANLCSCGATVSFSSVDTKEKHNFHDRICTDCGFEKGTGLYDTDPLQMGEEAILGNYGDSVTVSGIITEILVGEIPLIGLAADIRDIFYDIQNDAGFVQTSIDALALLPLLGGAIKYSDEIGDLLKYSDEIADVVKNSDEVADAITSGEKATEKVGGYSLKYLRRKAVDDAWTLEYLNVKEGGTGLSRQWNDAERVQLLSTGRVKGYQGHHMYSVWKYPDKAGDASHIQFLKPSEHFAAHSNSWRHATDGQYFDYTQFTGG